MQDAFGPEGVDEAIREIGTESFRVQGNPTGQMNDNCRQIPKSDIDGFRSGRQQAPHMLDIGQLIRAEFFQKLGAKVMKRKLPGAVRRIAQAWQVVNHDVERAVAPVQFRHDLVLPMPVLEQFEHCVHCESACGGAPKRGDVQFLHLGLAVIGDRDDSRVLEDTGVVF